MSRRRGRRRRRRPRRRGARDAPAARRCPGVLARPHAARADGSLARPYGARRGPLRAGPGGRRRARSRAGAPGAGGLGPAGGRSALTRPLGCGSGMAVLDQRGLEAARAQTLALVAGVSDADPERVHSPLLSPLVWDLGHIASFEDLWLAHNHGGLPLLRVDLAEVYDAFETPRAKRGALPYLRRAEAERYMEAVRERVRGLDLRGD